MSKVKTKKCSWCGKEFEIYHHAQKYCCEEHRKEANTENVRKAKTGYYFRNKKSIILKQLGTTTMGIHPNPDFKREQTIISKEKKRTFTSSNYKGVQTYNKGRIKFTFTNPSIENYQLGTLKTHNYANFNDYSSQHTNLILKQNIKHCPECKSDFIVKDKTHAEVSCGSCGLVLLGPPTHGIVYPWKNTACPINEIPDYDTTYHPYPKVERNLFNENVNVVCKSCFYPYNIPWIFKEFFKCRCGSKVIGCGICMPHNFKDEFVEITFFEISYDLRVTEARAIGT